MKRYAVLKVEYTKSVFDDKIQLKNPFYEGEIVEIRGIGNYFIVTKLDKPDYYYSTGSDFEVIEINWIKLR
jgi:hypothetical protein